MKTMKITILSAILLGAFAGCKKEFLDAKPSTNILTPQTLDDYRALLDNTTFLYNTPAIGHLAADEYQYVNDQAWEGALGGATERNSYIWAKDIYEGETDMRDWSYPYQTVFYANNTIEGIEKTGSPASAEYNQIKGWAFFLRGWAFFNLVNTFAKNYDEATATSDLGIPIRLSASIDEISPRATVQESYDQVLSDLKRSAGLLTSTFQHLNRNRPSKCSAYAALARVYLCMNKYVEAELYADSSLNLYNQLADYNTVSTTATTPFSNPNVESLFFASLVQGYFITQSSASNTATTVDSELLGLYSANDLRLPVYFAKTPAGNYYRRRGYAGAVSTPFSGPATDEMYLIKAECLARRNQVIAAMGMLNTLLVKRFKNTVPYVPVTAGSQQEAIATVLLERKKELNYRGLRWLDIKRLNKIGANITLRRTVKGIEYVLPPNDPRYALPIPDEEVTRSGIAQNPR